MPMPGASGSRYLRLPDLHATPTVLPSIRDHVMSWARDAGLGEDQVTDVGLAVYEAMANVADHAYPQPGGPFSLYAYRDDGDVTITVADHGQWKPPEEDNQANRGRGLLMICKLVREFHLTRHTRGTIVRMTWRARRQPRVTLDRP
jgi:serine/threonine-protein kinase RsbW